MEEPIELSVKRPPGRYLWMLLLAAAVVHLPALFSPFFIDDYVYVSQVNDLDWHKALGFFRSATLDQSASSVWWAPSGMLPFYRPIGQLSFAVDHCFWGLRPFGYHLTNVALHLVCTLLVWRLAGRLFKSPRYALVAAAVFALHPVHMEAVMWISGRFDLLVCACALASVFCYLRYSDAMVGGRGWAVLSVLCFALALGCKETALILPIVLVCVEALRAEKGTQLFSRRLLLVLAAFAAIAALYLAGRVALFGGLFGRLPPPYGLDTSSPLVAFKNLGWNLAQYLFDLALFIHVEPVWLPQFWSEHRFLFAAALAVSALLLVGAVKAGRGRIFGIGAAWLALFTAPSLLSMPGERNVYLASAGLALAIAAVFRGLDLRRAARSHPEDPPATSGWLRRATFAVVGLWLVVNVTKGVLMGCVAFAGEKEYRDLQAMLPDPPRGARIYIVNQNPLNSVGFTQAIRLRYGRNDLFGCALSMSPTLYASSTDRIVRLGPDSIRLVRESGTFFNSFVERFHRFSQPASTLAEAGRRCGLELLDPPPSYDNLRMLEFRLPYPLDDPRIQVFRWDNHRIRGKLDLLRMGTLAELRPCRGR